MAKTIKTVHMTEFPTKALAHLFLGLKARDISTQQIASALDVTVQKIGAILRHAKK